jgi:hypothetical protein
MEMSRRLIDLIGAAVVAVVLIAGMSLAVLPLFGTAKAASDEALALTRANESTRVRVEKLAEQNTRLAELQAEQANLRLQITINDERLDASALAATAARSSGARVTEITFGDREVFIAPVGGGLGSDGKPLTKRAAADANTVQVQIPVTFEANVSNATQAAAFVDGLRGGPRLLQVVQAECSPSGDPKLSTVTVDALMFSVRG